jgi:hypothetical protein
MLGLWGWRYAARKGPNVFASLEASKTSRDGLGTSVQFTLKRKSPTLHRRGRGFGLPRIGRFSSRCEKTKRMERRPHWLRWLACDLAPVEAHSSDAMR